MPDRSGYDREANDWYVEEAWAVHLLVEYMQWAKITVHIHDPCCGMGTIPMACRAHGIKATGSDLIDRGFGEAHGERADFMAEKFDPSIMSGANIIASNPPFILADDFIRFALAQEKISTICVLLPAGWGHAAGTDKARTRHKWLRSLPLALELKIGPRPSMPPGKLILKGIRPGGGKGDFSWWIFRRGHKGLPQSDWLTRRDDVT